MWFLIIVQIILAYTPYTVARCPASEASIRSYSYCPRIFQNCSYMKCYCKGKYQKKTTYYCARWRRWIRLSGPTKCPPCPTKCRCTSKKQPVCATNRRTYTNKCHMRCANAKYKCAGKCPCRRFRPIKFRPIKFRPYRPRRSLRRYRPRRSFRRYRRSFRSFRG